MPGPEMATYTTVFRASDENRVRRNRQAVSCIACQKRKTKCDRQHPCWQCEKRGDGASCVFGQQQQKQQQQGSVQGGGRQEVQARLNRLEDMVNDLAQDSQGRPHPRAYTGVRRDPATGARDRSGGDEAGATYHGSTSWAALVESIHGIRNVLELEGEDEVDQVDTEFASLETDVILGDMAPITMKEIADSVPCRTDADRLISTYFNSKFMAVPFIHVHQFRRRYEAFWEDPESVGFLWISMLFSILSASAMVANLRGFSHTQQQPIAEPRAYMRLSARCLIAGEYLKAKKLSVEALLTHTHCRNIQQTDSETTVWALIGLTCRLAQKRGYHREASKISARTTPFEAEMQRRVWFMIQSIDLLFSFQHGMPTMVDDEVCDTEDPTNLTDEDFDEDTAILPPPRPESDPLPILAYIYKSRLCRILRRVIRHALGTNPKPFSETLELDRHLKEWYASLPPCLRFTSIRDTSFTDANHTIMHRLMLELTYHKTLCVLHRPYLTVDRDDSSKYAMSKQTCRNAALRLIMLHIEFDQEVKPGRRMHDDRYMVSTLTLQDFLISAMVLCLDLSESTDISLEDREYRVQVLRTCYDMWSARGNSYEHSQHATKVLRAILRKVETPSSASSDTQTPSVAKTPDDSVSGGRSIVSNPDSRMTDAAQYPPDKSSPAMNDFNMGFGDLARLDTTYGDPVLDWATIDDFLRDDAAYQSAWDPLLNVGH